MSHVIHVAVGVIVGDRESILIAKRPDKTHQGGLWEFPGGKVEQNETLFEALRRELREELAIDIITTEPLIKIRHDYGDKVVLLDVHKVTHFAGEPKGNEGQPIAWVAPKLLYDYEFPAANRPIITAINLPQRMLITGEFNGLNDFVCHVERALQSGIRLIQLRLRKAENFLVIVERISALCEHYSARLQINTNPDLFSKISNSKNLGLHLNSKNLLACHLRPVANSVLWSASCHTQAEIEHAEKIGVDFICLSPVLETASHPEQEGIGWRAFELLVGNATVPVYALGGMQETDLDIALACGAQGIAAISEWW